MNSYIENYSPSTLESLENRITTYEQTILAYHNGLCISEREYHLALVKVNCLQAQKRYLEYLYCKNNLLQPQISIL